MHKSLPDELTCHIFGFCSATCLLMVEAASRALRDLREHKQHDLHWCGLLVARWPREDPVLLSLRPRATARQLYRAFSTKRDARTQIMRRPERVIYSEDAQRHRQAEDETNYGPGRLAFLVCVGPFAGLARWMDVPVGIAYSSAMKPGLAWEPQTGTSFDIEFPQDVHTLDEQQLFDGYGDQIAQSLHVIDLRTHKCVTLFSDIVPWSINIHTMDDNTFPHSEVGDVTTYSSHLEWRSFRHNHMRDFDEDDLQELYHESCLGSVGYRKIEHCILGPFLTLRPATRLYQAELSWSHAEYMTVLSPLAVCEYLGDTIEQTHEEGWQRVRNLDLFTDDSDGIDYADNR